VKKILIATVSVFSLLLAACAPQTPATRIEANRGKYAPLSEHHKDLVSQGKIERGMSGNAVYLAWGSPSRVYEGTSSTGVSTTRWEYARLQAVTSTSFYGGYGFGGGHRYYGRGGGYGWGGYSSSYYGVSPEINYIPYRSATVLFRSGLVDSWERTRTR